MLGLDCLGLLVKEREATECRLMDVTVSCCVRLSLVNNAVLPSFPLSPQVSFTNSLYCSPVARSSIYVVQNFCGALSF